MPRKPSSVPSFHKASGQWCCYIKRRRQYLGKDFRAAKRAMRAMLAAEADEVPAADDSTVAGRTPVQEVAARYIHDLAGRRSAHTVQGMRARLKRAVAIVGEFFPTSSLRCRHLDKIEQAMREKYSPTTIADTIAALQSVVAWAVRREILTANPLAGYSKPARRSRTRVMTDDEFAYLLTAASRNKPFGRLLVAMRYTGCRPAEIRELRWSDVRLDDGLWILTKHKTITQQRQPAPRIIPLNATVLMLCRLLHRSGRKKPKPSEHVFLNEAGRPWTKDAICRAMARCVERAGLGDDVVPYTSRHTFGTNAVGKVDPFELAGLMGHTSIRTTQRYVHLSAERLKEASERLNQPK